MLRDEAEGLPTEDEEAVVEMEAAVGRRISKGEDEAVDGLSGLEEGKGEGVKVEEGEGEGEVTGSVGIELFEIGADVSGAGEDSIEVGDCERVV